VWGAAVRTPGTSRAAVRTRQRELPARRIGALNRDISAYNRMSSGGSGPVVNVHHGERG
jgi:hypothetical protein